MLIETKDKYIDSLIKLWNKVFGDDEDYIKLFFKDAYYDCECFAEIYDDEVVSAFYLLKCIIKLDGKIYNGRYLYAAATLPEYRNKGLMGKVTFTYGVNGESLVLKSVTKYPLMTDFMIIMADSALKRQCISINIR